MKIFLFIICIVQLITILVFIYTEPKHNNQLLNMSNTISPIISKLAETLGGYDGVQITIGDRQTPIGGKLIYKREKIIPENGMSCISDVGNVYYIRLYEWDYNKNWKLWYRPIKDINIGCYSCIDEEDILIPYWDKELQYATLGEKYFVGISRGQ